MAHPYVVVGLFLCQPLIERNPTIAILQILNEYYNIFQSSENTDLLEKPEISVIQGCLMQKARDIFYGNTRFF
jgi:hypothetical protein